MFVVTFVLHEKTGLDRKEALRYWADEHGAIVRRVPGVQRYVQQHALSGPDGAAPFLGVASLTFGDEDTFRAAAASSEFADAIADVANFADETRLPTGFMEEVVIVG